MEQADREVLESVEALAREHCRFHDPAHDVAHLDRVIANATRILTAERQAGQEIDDLVVFAACWLHDAVQLPKDSAPPGESAQQSAELAQEFLLEQHIDRKRAEHVAASIRTHSFSGGERPATIEAGIVQDADRLDALGAVGLARLWVVAGDLGSKLYHESQPVAADRQLDDKRYALDHIDTKLMKLPGLMNTNAGRSLAADRVQFIVAYRDQFLSELPSPK